MMTSTPARLARTSNIRLIQKLSAVTLVPTSSLTATSRMERRTRVPNVMLQFSRRQEGSAAGTGPIDTLTRTVGETSVVLIMILVLLVLMVMS